MWTSHALVDIPALIFEPEKSNMSKPSCTLEFKEEAIRQFLDRCHPVAAVSDRLDISAHKLSEWIKAVQPSDSEQAEEEIV